jgi:hypothetical protein
MHKRDQGNSKLGIHGGHASGGHLHVNQINLDGTSSASNYRLNSRNKSAMPSTIELNNSHGNIYNHSGHGNQQQSSANSSHNAAINNNNNNNANNTNSPATASTTTTYSINNTKMQNLIAKNFIDYNLIASTTTAGTSSTNTPTPPGQHQQIYQLNSGKNVRNLYPQPQQFNVNNVTVGQEPGRFIEDILAHSRRNSLAPNVVNNNNKENSHHNPNNLGRQSTSIQLPINIAIINRTNEERYLSPDKLIVER